MISTEYSFLVEPGTTHVVDFLVESSPGTPLDMTGWQVRFKATTRPDGGEEALSYVTPSPSIDVTSGKVALTIHATDLALAVPRTGRALSYTLEIDDNAGTVYRPFKGTIALTPRV